MSEWKIHKLSEVVDIISGGTPKTSVAEYWNGLIPWLSVADFNNGKKFVSTAEKSITELGLENCSSKLLQKNDIIISARGTVGVVAMLEREMAFNQSCYGIRAKENSTNEYIYYFLKSAVKDFLQVANGGVFDTITRQTFDEIEISLPPLPEQKAIAEVLTSLDDKIDLLHKQNKTLEQLAETLFEEWIEGKDFDGSVSQLISIQNGYAFKSSDFKELGNFGVLKIKNISSGIININQTDFVEDPLSLEMSKKFSVKSGDILIGMTGAEIGKLGVVPKTDKFLYLNQRVGLLREKYEGAKYLAYIHLKSEFGQDYIDNAATGSAQPNISGVGIEECTFPVLTESQIKEYSNQIAPFYEKIVFNLGQIQSLEKLRDQLLPKLMSGELQINNEAL